MMYLSLTFDYELFFGDNHDSFDNVLFGPTYKLIDALEHNGISATFFADVCSVPVSMRYGQMGYIESFTKQLRYMAQHGQDVQLHLHPHWFYSDWKDNQWSFSNKGYRLHEFIDDGRINDIVTDGIEYLNNTLKAVDPAYRCIAYRAGGFSMQPHQKIVGVLYDHGVRIDSSVAPQLVTKSEANFYDYRHPLKTQNWNISDKAEWWQDSSEGKSLLEIPVATIDKSTIDFIYRRIFKPQTVKLNLGPKRGSYIPIHTEHENKLKTCYNYVIGYNAISMDAYAADFLYKQVKRLQKRTKCENQIVAVIGHPKLVNQIYINNLVKFIDKIKADRDLEFVSICRAYKQRRLDNGNKKK